MSAPGPPAAGRGDHLRRIRVPVVAVVPEFRTQQIYRARTGVTQLPMLKALGVRDLLGVRGDDASLRSLIWPP